MVVLRWEKILKIGYKAPRMASGLLSENRNKIIKTGLTVIARPELLFSNLAGT